MITTDFDKMSFHDTAVKSIRRKDSAVVIKFEDAFLRKNHPASGDHDWRIDKGVLRLLNVKNEVAKFWYDDKEGKTHPNPKFPLDEITNLDFEDGVFKFGGYLG